MRRFSSSPNFKEKQFFKNQPFMCRRGVILQIGERFAFRGKMHLRKRRPAVEQFQSPGDRRRNSIRNVRRQIIQSAMNDATEPARCELSIRRRLIDRHNAADLKRLNVPGAFQRQLAFTAACLIQQFKLWLRDLQAAAFPAFFHLAVQGDELARFEAVTQVFTVEPDAFQRGAPLTGD